MLSVRSIRALELPRRMQQFTSLLRLAIIATCGTACATDPTPVESPSKGSEPTQLPSPVSKADSVESDGSMHIDLHVPDSLEAAIKYSTLREQLRADGGRGKVIGQRGTYGIKLNSKPE